MTLIEEFDGGNVINVALDPDGTWARSEFPHPLVVVDYDAEDRPIAIQAAGPLAHASAKGAIDVLLEALEPEARQALNEQLESVPA